MPRLPIVGGDDGDWGDYLNTFLEVSLDNTNVDQNLRGRIKPAALDTAGAVMNTDTTTADMQFVVDEDNMASDSATKVPTQQSVKAYVDNSDSTKVTGPASATDRAISVFDGTTGKLIKNTSITTNSGGTELYIPESGSFNTGNHGQTLKLQSMNWTTHTLDRSHIKMLTGTISPTNTGTYIGVEIAPNMSGTPTSNWTVLKVNPGSDNGGATRLLADFAVASSSKLTLSTKGIMRNNAPLTGAINTYKNVAYTRDSSASKVGTLKITLPKSWTNAMLRMDIKGFDYTYMASNWNATISGYTYSAGSSWYNSGVTLNGTPPFTSVRLGHDGTNCCILLGTTSTTWAFPQIEISDLQAGNDHTGWDTGWDMAFITDETGITISPTHGTPTIKRSVENTNISSTNNAIVLFDGTTGNLIKDSTITIDIDGALTANSDTKIASQKAVKTYVDNSSATASDITVQTVTSNYTMLSSDDVVLANASSGNVTISIVTATNRTRPISIKKIDSSTNTVIVDGFSSELIDGGASATLANQYESITLVSDNSNYYIT